MLEMSKKLVSRIFRRGAWRVLPRLLALMLLFTHQSWAGAVCFCEHEGEHQHDCSQVAHHCDSSMAAHHGDWHGDRDANSSMPCSEEERTLVQGDQLDSLPQSVRLGCHSLPPTDAQALSVSSPIPVQIVPIQPFNDFSLAGTSAFASTKVVYPPHSRPLYLTLSCLLI